MNPALLRLLALLAAPSAAVEIIETPGDVAAVRAWVDDIRSDPGGEVSRRRLETFVQNRLDTDADYVAHRRERALRQALRLEPSLGGGPRTGEEIARALVRLAGEGAARASGPAEPGAASEAVIGLVGEAHWHLARGEEEKGLLALRAAVVLGPLAGDLEKARAADKPVAPAARPAPVDPPQSPAPIAMPAAPEPIAAAPATATEHIVRKGDTLWSLARGYYGDGNHWRRILKANPGLKDQQSLEPGERLAIPLP